MAVHVLVFALGCLLILTAISSAIRTFVVPRGMAPDALTRGAFVVMRTVIEVPFRAASHLKCERALAYFAPRHTAHSSHRVADLRPARIRGHLPGSGRIVLEYGHHH